MTPIGRDADTRRCIWLNPLDIEDEDDWRTGETPKKALPDDHHGNPNPHTPLFPLLPSVQNFFASFCGALIEAVQAAQQY
jgi:hypothetical protein